MKQVLLYLILASLSLTGVSQSLELWYDDRQLEQGEEITLEAYADSGLISFEGLEVLNMTNDPVKIKVAREVLNSVANTQNSFFWGTGYPPGVDTSSLSVKIEGGEFSTEFTGEYSPNGNSGITSVKYTFFELGNPENQAIFVVNYKATNQSGLEGNNGSIYVSPVYPNPANSEAKMDYSLSGENGDIRFVLRNLLGTIVKEIEITENSGSLTLNTSGLTEGIYFYSLLIDNESFVTHKLIIKH